MTSPQHYEMLFHRHDANPDSDGGRLAVPGTHRLQRRGDAASGRHDAAALPGRGPARPFASVRRPIAQRRRRLDDRCASPRSAPIRSRYPEELWGIEDPRITFVEELVDTSWPTPRSAEADPAWRSRSPRTSAASSARPRHAARRQGRRAAAPPHQRQLRAAASPGDGLGRAHLDLVLAGPAQLGRTQARAARAARRVVGRQQRRAVAAADRDAARMAHAVSRRPANGGRLPVSAGRWRCWTSRPPSTASCEATRGSSVPRRRTNARATWATSRSPAATRWAPTATPSTFITAPPTRASRWRPAASANSSIGWIGMAQRRSRWDTRDRRAARVSRSRCLLSTCVRSSIRLASHAASCATRGLLSSSRRAARPTACSTSSRAA